MISFFCSHLHFSFSLLPSLLLFSFLLLFNSNLRLLKKIKSRPGWGGNTLNLIIRSLLQHSVPEPTEKSYWTFGTQIILFSFIYYLTSTDLHFQTVQSLISSWKPANRFWPHLCLLIPFWRQLRITNCTFWPFPASSTCLVWSCLVLLLRNLGPPFYEHLLQDQGSPVIRPAISMSSPPAKNPVSQFYTFRFPCTNLCCMLVNASW